MITSFAMVISVNESHRNRTEQAGRSHYVEQAGRLHYVAQPSRLCDRRSMEVNDFIRGNNCGEQARTLALHCCKSLHRASNAVDDSVQTCGCRLECDSLDSAAHEHQLNPIGETVDKLLDGQGVEAELDFVVGEEVGRGSAAVADTGFVVEDRPSSVGGFEETVDGAGDDDRSRLTG